MQLVIAEKENDQESRLKEFTVSADSAPFTAICSYTIGMLIFYAFPLVNMHFNPLLIWFYPFTLVFMFNHVRVLLARYDGRQ